MIKMTINSICKWLLVIAVLSFTVTSCNKDEVIETKSPSITFDEESGIYTVKVGKSITITPTVKDATNPKYSWKAEGSVVGTNVAYTFTSDEIGEHFVTFKVEADNGSAEEEIRIDVVENMKPIISLVEPEGGYTVVKGEELKIAAQVKFSQGATFKWKLNGSDAGSDSIYIFKQTTPDSYSLSLTVTNEDGSDEKGVTVKVVDALPLQINFEGEDENGITIMTASLDRPLYITPIIINDTENTTFQWYQDETLIPTSTGKILEFIPNQIKEYKIKVIGTTPGQTAVEKSITVKCVAAEGEFYREATSSSKAEQNKVYEFRPAPGQFINEGYNASTKDDAIAFAEGEMKKGYYVSLGGFGGYIVVGFDHSILNISRSYESKYDFAIDGNSFPGSSEPGIVWVMQDENGNGLPDDTWYELKGSEYGKSETTQNYAVTYYKPSAPGMDVQWRDNKGNTGSIKYLKQFHAQDYYYPNWVKTNSYTLRGTCLKARNVYNENTGNWENKGYDWGYADNFGEDKGSNDNNSEANPNANFFKISNAVYANGTPVDLHYIDFIKVQTGVNAQSGWIGEVSTEVFGFKDLNLNK
jgi:hypothetical protein